MALDVRRAVGSAADLHARPFEAPSRLVVHVLDVDRPALVLGSAQPDDVVDRDRARAAGVEVVRRRSGGGAVLLEPGGTVWVDVELPRDDDRWVDDVGRAAWWVGEAWTAALGDLGVPDPAVHRGGLERRRWGDLVCFAGLGPGEVTSRGAKVVGLSQRRTRAGARFQCAVPRSWVPERLATLLALDDGDRRRLVEDLAGAVRAVDVTADAVVDAFVAHL